MPRTAKPIRSSLCHFGIVVLVALVCGLGCKEWNPKTEHHGWNVPTVPASIDTVRLEVGVAQLEESQQKGMTALWRALDFQKLPLDVRRELDEYGLKVAVMSSRPPAVFGELMKPGKVDHEKLNEFDRQLFLRGLLKPTERLIGHTRVSSRQGQAYPVMTSDTFAFYSWTAPSELGAQPQSGENVRGCFSISTYPQGDGSVRVMIVPEIHHGKHQKRYGSTEHGFKYETAQQVQQLDAIRFDVDLRVGETLVIGPTEDLAGLGQLFFVPNANQTESPEDLDQVPLEDLETTMDELAQLALQPLDSESLALPDAEPEASPLAEQSEPKTDQERLEAEVRKMLTVQPGEEIALPKFGYDQEAERPSAWHRLLLIRVLQSRRDNLFKEIDDVEPLTNVDRY